MKEELSAVDIVQHKVEFGAGLEGVVEPHQERVSHVLQQHVPLGHDVLDLVPSDDGLLLEHLDGIALAGQLVSRQVHLGGGGGGGGGGEGGGGGGGERVGRGREEAGMVGREG